VTAADVRGVVSRSFAAVGRLPDRFLDRIARLPSTNFRVFITLGCVVWTTARYLTNDLGWEPSLEWLGFLATMSGLDLATFTVKRRTQNGHGAPPPPEPGS
jgi:hypothetical protein